MKRLAVAVSGLMMASVAVSAVWDDDVTNVNGDVFNVDLDSIKNSSYKFNSIVGFWTKAKYAKNHKPLVINGKNVRSSKFFEWVNCKDKTISNQTQNIYYDVNEVIIKTQSSPIQGFSEIIPESTAEIYFNTACSIAMWKEYFTIPSDSNGKKNQYQLDSLIKRYPYQAHLLEGKEYEPQ